SSHWAVGGMPSQSTQALSDCAFSSAYSDRTNASSLREYEMKRSSIPSLVGRCFPGGASEGSGSAGAAPAVDRRCPEACHPKTVPGGCEVDHYGATVPRLAGCTPEDPGTGRNGPRSWYNVAA